MLLLPLTLLQSKVQEQFSRLTAAGSSLSVPAPLLASAPAPARAPAAAAPATADKSSLSVRCPWLA